MTEANRIDVHEARRRVTAGDALLVCGYEDEARCQKLALEGAIPLTEFRNRLESVPKDREIIFYCA